MQKLQVISDDVMGDQSRSKLLRGATGLLFEAEVLFADGGGLASFRAPPLRLVDVQAFGPLTCEGRSAPFRMELELLRAA